MVRPAELIQHQDMLHRLTGDQTGQPLATRPKWADDVSGVAGAG